MPTIPSNYQSNLDNAIAAYNKIKLERDDIKNALDTEKAFYSTMQAKSVAYQNDSRTWTFAAYTAWNSNGKFISAQKIDSLTAQLIIKDAELADAQRNIDAARKVISDWQIAAQKALETDPQYVLEKAKRDAELAKQNEELAQAKQRNTLIFIIVLIVVLIGGFLAWRYIKG